MCRQFGNGSFSTPVQSPLTAAPRHKLSLDRLDSYVAEDSEPVEAEEFEIQEETGVLEEEESKEIMEDEEKKSATAAIGTTPTQFSSVLTAFPEIGQELRKGGSSIVADGIK